MLLKDLSASISFLIIVSFIPLLNFSTKDLSSYPLPLTALLNSYTNSSIILFPYFTFFNLATFIISSSPLPNSFFKFAKDSSTIAYSNISASNSSKMFSFQISADPPHTYDNTHWICSSIVNFLILILIYNLHTIKNPETFPASLLNIYGFVTSMFDPVLG